MKAIVCDRYGPPEVLRLEDVEAPQPGAGEVRLRVHAASLNRGDWHLMSGIPYLVRVIGFGLRRPKQRIIGQDVAGVVEAVGAGVTRWQSGDEVFGYGAGTFAEQVCVPEAQLQQRPPHLTLEEAATLPTAGVTALHALREQAGLKAGQSVLILGAAGSVGSFAVALAKALGAEVTGVCSARNLERARVLGADHVIDYAAEDFAAAGRRYDVVVRIAGPYGVRQCRRTLTPRGTLVLVGGGRMGRWLGGMERFMGTKLLNLVTRQRLRPFVSMLQPTDLEALRELIERHALRPRIDGRYPLAEAAEAMRLMATGHAPGKLVLTP